MSDYGADQDIPNTYDQVPDGFTEGSASFAELKTAGFHQGVELGEDKPGQQPVDEMLVEGDQILTPDVAAQVFRNARFGVLRDPEEKIVATWDEGRWWTPSESDEFSRQVAEELPARPRMNRAERRARRRRGRDG